jgi:transcriptional regulator with XRE-family HTH domain
MPKTAASDVAMKVVGRNIREARLEVGLTQAALAERMGVNPSYVTNVEAGRVNLTVGQLANIASALGTGLDVRLPVLSSEPVRISVAT